MTLSRTAIVLSAHGSPASLDDLPQFLANVRRGRPAPEALLVEVRRRYEAIGGHSPLLPITEQLASSLESRTHHAVRVVMRLWEPYANTVVPSLLHQGVDTIVSLPIAPYSVHVYHPSVRAVVREPARLIEVPAWNMHPLYLQALSRSLEQALTQVNENPEHTAVVLTAHSLPTRVVDAGDPYATLFEQTANAIAQGVLHPRGIAWTAAYQSQGASEGPWLGPDLFAALRSLRERNIQRVLVMPIGFPTDHIEVLYDLDIEARHFAESLGLAFTRVATLNASTEMVDVLEALVQTALSGS